MESPIKGWLAEYERTPSNENVGVMNNQDTVRKAVLLADGWDISTDDYYYGPYVVGAHISNIKQSATDALAAQLVRQVDARWDQRNPQCPHIIAFANRVECWATGWPPTVTEGLDRTMNTIKAIVDSKVLE